MTDESIYCDALVDKKLLTCLNKQFGAGALQVRTMFGDPTFPNVGSPKEPIRKE